MELRDRILGCLTGLAVCDALGNGRVISIDIAEGPGRPPHPRIQYLQGSSTAAETVARVRELIGEGERVLVILDSDHSAAHVLEELRLYAPLARSGDYVIVEDTDVNGHPVAPEHGPGPFEAVQEFLRGSDDFEIDRSREKFHLTMNPSGYLRRKGS